MSKKLVVWGASSHAMVVADVIRLQGHYEIVGFLDSINPERVGTEFCGASILGGEEQLDVLLQQGIAYLIVGIGSGRTRLRLADLVFSKGYKLATAIHPRASVATEVTIGAGTVILAGAVINPGAKLGENVLVLTCASVEHECEIEDGVTISGGVQLGGRVTVERAATVEIGATVARGIRIGQESVVGAGAVVLHDVPSNVLAYGTPAKVIRKISGYDY